ncbi:MAG: hypothetical protein FWD68_15205 [Alphaproteobacteria bacterium]|nr:hypothetical protein [Alphaproteobacteria bacterium]
MADLQSLFKPRRESVIRRNQAFTLARGECTRAYAVARTIEDGWYRCQAMAEIGAHAPEELSAKAFREARRAAAEAFDNYQRAGVLAFAIAAASRRGRRDLVEVMLADALRLVPSVEPMASRASALHLLWGAIACCDDDRLCDLVIARVRACVDADRSWRARRLHCAIVDWLHERDAREAQAFVRAMPGGRARNYLERRIGVADVVAGGRFRGF